MASIYVSSTYSDLQAHREKVYRVLRQLGHEVVAMEDYVATDQRPLAKCLADVAACDLYVGIFAHRYGYVPEHGNPEGRSITELEYRHAEGLDIPRLVFLLDPTVQWTPTFMDAFTGEGDHGTRIQTFREELGRDRLASFFSTADELAQKVGVAVTNHLATDTAKRTGPRPAPMPAALFFLPPDIEDLTGRDAPLTSIVELLGAEERLHPTAVRVVAISGFAGVGKTALAVHAGHILGPRFPDGQLYLNLRGAEPQQLDPAELLAELLRSFGVPGTAIPLGLEERQQLYRRQLVERHALLVLDNAAKEAQVRPLLPGHPSCAVLITSRQRLSALEGAHFIDLEVLSPDNAVHLLDLIVGEGRVEREQAAAAELVRLCDYMPLAVRIIGARLAARRHLQLVQLVERLQDEHRRLDELKVGDREVRAAFALSYESRSEPERRLFRLLGLIRAEDFAAWVAAALLQVPLVDAEDLLERLVDAQLLEAKGDAAGMTRYRFHDLLRVYARERLRKEESDPDQRAALMRALSMYLEQAGLAAALAQSSGTKATGDAAADRPASDPSAMNAVARDPIAWLATERAGLVAAVERAHEAGMWDLTWDLANTLPAFLELQANWTDWRRVLDLALDAARRAGNLQQQGSALLSLGRLSWDQDRWEEATSLLHDCLAIVRQIGDRRWEALTVRTIGELHRDQAHWDEAVRCYHLCLPAFREFGDQWAAALTERNLGDVYRDLGRWDEAMNWYGRCLSAFREAGDRRAVAITVRAVAEIERDRGRLDEALRGYLETLDVFRGLGDRRWEAFTLRGLAVLHHKARRWTEAIGCCQESLAIFAELTDRRGRGITLRNLGDVHRDYNRLDEAMRCYDESLLILREIGDRRWEAITLCSKGEAHRRLGRLDEAVTSYADSARTLGELRDHREEAFALFGLGGTRRAQHRLGEAIDCLQRCLAVFRDFGDQEWEARTMVALGLALDGGGEQGEALALWRDALPVLDALNMPEAAEIHARLHDGAGLGPDSP